MKSGVLLDSSRERALLISAIVLGLLLRVTMGWQAPLWLDETYTAVISAQQDPADLYGWMRRELTGPVFYGLSWLVARFAGISDLGLRAPSFLLAVAAILVIVWRGHEDARLRLTWAAFLALWWPGIYQASQARPQALLVFLAVVQAIAFIKVWRSGSVRWLWVWTGVTAAMLLTHVYAAVPGGLQFLALAWWLRRAWRGYAITLAAFIPVLAWYAGQIPFYLSFARPGVASYPVLQPEDVVAFAPDLLGGAPALAWVILTLAAGFTLMHFRDRPKPPGGRPQLSGEAVLSLCGIGAALLIFSVGMLRPSYVPRYMVPCAPAVLLGVSMALLRAKGSWRLTFGGVLLLAVLQSILAGSLSLSQNRQREIYSLEFQQASEWLMQGGPRRPVLFTWDYPVAAINPDSNLIEIGGFFFKRAGNPRDIIVQRPPSGTLGAEPLVRAAHKYKADLIWIGDRKWPRGLMNAEGLHCRLWHRKGYSKSVACRYIG